MVSHDLGREASAALSNTWMSDQSSCKSGKYHSNMTKYYTRNIGKTRLHCYLKKIQPRIVLRLNSTFSVLPCQLYESYNWLQSLLARQNHALSQTRLQYMRLTELTMKSPVVINSTLVSKFLRINLKTLPISFLEIFDTAHISVKKIQ